MADFRDLRKSPRLAVELAIDYTSEHNFFAGRTGNIGAGGLFIVCDAPMPVGTVLTVALSLPNHQVRTEAEVVWTAEAPAGSGGLSGMGLRFRKLSRLDEAKIESFIRQREPLLYEEEDLPAAETADEPDLVVDVEPAASRTGPPPLPAPKHAAPEARQLATPGRSDKG